MADSWQSAWVEVLPDLSEFRRTANGQMSGILGGAGTAGATSFGSSFVGGVRGLVGPIAAAIAALGIARLVGEAIGAGINYGLGALDLASSLQETRNAADQLFGEASASVQEFAATANEALGQTQQQAIDAANTFALFGKSAGLTGEDLSTFSTELVTLATDLASFKDLPVDQAIQAIGAALRGESEPIRTFGVLLDDAALKQQALTSGIYDGNGALTQQQRVLAAHALILAQTTDQQGDFARNQTGYAAQLKTFESALLDTQAALGTELLPAATDFLRLMNEEFVPIIRQVNAEVGPILSQALRDSAPAFSEMLAAVAPLIPDLVRLAVSGIPPLVALIQILTPLIQEWARSMTAANNIVSGLADFLAGTTSFAEFAAKVMDTESVIFGFVNSVGATVGSLHRTISTALAGAGNWLVSSGRALIQGFIDGINAMFAPVRNAVSGIINFVAGFFPNSPARHGPLSGAGWRAIGNSGSALIDQFTSGLHTDFDVLPRLNVARASGFAGAGDISGSSGGGLRDVHFHTEDPTVAFQMFKQEIGGELAIR